MEMILTGIENKNEYYTNHYFTSIFQDNAEDTIKKWKEKEKTEEIQLPWKKLRDVRTQYYNIRDRYLRSKNEEVSKPLVQELATLYLDALGYGSINSVTQEVADGVRVPIFHEVTKTNGAPLLWAFLSVAVERDDDILNGYIFEKSDDEEEEGASVDVVNDEILAKLFFAGDEAPRFILLLGINQIALIDRNKWNEKRYLQFMMEDIYSRHEESTFMAMTVLLHKESLCPSDGNIVLDGLDENSHKHSAGVSDALKYALRESIEILGNEVIYDMKTRQGIDFEENPVDAAELTLECLRYMYRFLFMLFIEARPELGYAPMKSQAYVQGYSLEGLRDVCEQVKEDSEALSEGYYIDDTLKKLFHMTYFGYPEDLEAYKKAIEIEKTSMHDAFTIEALKAHIFDPEYTKLITKARLRNSAMLQIVDLMSISRPSNSKERKGRISYSALGINQMGAVYEALLSYRGFIAEEDLYEVKRAGDKFNELDVGFFVKENELVNYDEKTERVRYESGEKKGQLRMYEKGTFIYRLAGREREKSASYYTPEVLTKCLVKYALKELLKDKTADEILHLTVCEPAMGSAAFLNEAINQLAEAYLTKKQEELGETISYDKRFEELQKVKMFIADRNVYGCDLNPVAVELAEVSLWLNTIYKGAYVPWFGTQLVNGNSLIGARRQVYSQSALEAGKWYDKAPRRIMPGENRVKDRQQKRTKEIYHFLLGDPGMAKYGDTVIKKLESDNIKIINEWRKNFTAKYTESDIDTLLNLSDSIDDLWKDVVSLKKKVEDATYEPLSVYGHEENRTGSHTTIKEKDEIFTKIFKSEHIKNAGPYARLKAAMDYWCALWFWPIDKADLLPDRQTFFFEMSLLLDGTIGAVSTSTSNQMNIFDSTGNFVLDDNGYVSLVTEGTEIAQEFQSLYATKGQVNLDELRKQHERLAIVNEIAKKQKFQHWELEFADVFEENGGFDLVIGNPPWIKIVWDEQGVLSEGNPLTIVKKLNATQTKKYRDELLLLDSFKKIYYDEYTEVSGEQNYLGSTQNYSCITGGINLYKCFLPLSFAIAHEESGVIAFVHPDAVFQDPKGGLLRKELYKRLRYHFQFQNELNLFAEVGHKALYSLLVYCNRSYDSFDSIANLFSPATIDECYSKEIFSTSPGGIKDENDNWNLKGHPDRIIRVNNDVLRLFCKLFGDNKHYEYAILPQVHTKQIIDTLICFSNMPNTISDISDRLFGTTCLGETDSLEAGIIVQEEQFPAELKSCIIQGPNISVGNPFFQSANRQCDTRGAFEAIDLRYIDEDFIQRCKYKPGELNEYEAKLPVTNWGEPYCNYYRVVSRKRLNLGSARTLNTAIIPPGVAHIITISGIASKRIEDIPIIAGLFSSLPYDFMIKTLGIADFLYSTAVQLPVIKGGLLYDAISYRALLLNCCSVYYSDLWEKCFRREMTKIGWLKEDNRLSDKYFKDNTKWNSDLFLKTEYERRQALIEIDVLTAMCLGMTLEQLINIYEIQFPVLKSYEDDTWYDSNGNIVFTNNRSLTNIGLSRSEWDVVKEAVDDCNHEYTTDSIPGGPTTINVKYTRPFKKCNRVNDYKEVWYSLEERIRLCD